MQEQDKKQQQSQIPPYKTGLRVNNSLQPKELQEFIPLNGRHVRIYNCGPTVYDSSHMGHARTYISVDMIRRILTKYFNYDLYFAMNITDIDDKIIIRSNELKEDFSTFARKWENEFWNDMQNLGVEYPDVIVRVSEHVPKIVTFIQQIIDNGYAYESNGSVYFDVPKFMEAPNHFYAKLAPLKVRDPNQREPEEANPDKRHFTDFALWKKSKAGEPKWPSQWSEGRPGWHIECSAMADDVLGYPIDIHMGGIDLKFPHHDNEIAQSEAYYNNPKKEDNQWVNYFIHTGHLNIDGLKMSKSLKNFITIENLLKHFSARQIRLVFLLHSYDSVMDYFPHREDENGNVTELRSMKDAIDKDQYYTNFYRTVIAILRQADIKDAQNWEQKEHQLNNLLIKVKENIHNHFLNNFNTQQTLKELEILISETNTYMNTKGIRKPLLIKVFNYVKFIFEVIGLDFEDRNTQSEEQKVFLNEISQVALYRDKVREFAQKDKQFDKIVEVSQEFLSVTQQFKSQAKDVIVEFTNNILSASQEKSFGKLMSFSDKIRDEDLPQLGIKIEDRAGESSLWKEEDKDILLKEMEMKKELKAKQAQEKAKKEQEKLLKQQQELEQMKINPKEMFLNDSKYSQFNENGIPTHDKEGKELNKKNQKYVEKQYNDQMKRYEQYLKLNNQSQ